MAFFLGLVATGVILAAELSGLRPEVYSGAGGGGLLGLVGFGAAWLIARPPKAAETEAGRGADIWLVWGAGLLIRVLLLGVLAFVFWRVWGANCAVPMVSMAAVYLVLLAGETVWLYGRLRSGEQKQTSPTPP